jgi:UDP-2,4-diacetamido-2,4,6-trideoxy-beta-L-altropyranose hydrolase
MRSAPKNVIVRADANSEIGTGHVMRCLALAQTLVSGGGTTTFLGCCRNPALRRRIRDAGARFVSLQGAHPNSADLRATLRFIGRLEPDWLVIDGYHFGPEYQKAARATGVQVLVIDDLAQWPEFHADIVLNQNLAAEKLPYVCDRDTELLLGMRYVMLRQEFLGRRGTRHPAAPVARRVLVTMGGSDPENATLGAIEALDKTDLPQLETVVIVGADNRHLEQLRAVSSLRRLSIRVVRNVQNMPDLMAWADMAITTAGGTVWELLFMGCPTLSFTRMPVQEADYRSLEQLGAMCCLGSEAAATPEHVATAIQDLAYSPTVRRRMSALGSKLVDGQGAARVVRAMRQRTDGSRAGCERLVRGAER